MDEIWWYVAHVLAIATQFGLLLAGIVAFPVSSQLSSNDDEFGVFLAWGSACVGMLGLVFSSVIFSALQKVDKAVGHSAYFQRRTTTIIGACVAITLAIGDTVLAIILGRQASALLRGLCAITAFAATFTTLSVVADIAKLYIFDREDAEEDRLMWRLQGIQL
ncbi:hypothetical protein F5Y10DRAFT_107412 [Nemania abortiva]|nr:hypothetical protein F5Y10DRAFT_107412 [Nemania abortiva]